MTTPAAAEERPRWWAVLSAILCAALFAGDAAAQSEERPQKVEKLSEWPALKKEQGDRARALMRQFGKKKQQLRDDAVSAMVQLGAGVAPLVVPKITDRPKNDNQHLFAVLDQVTDGRHAALLARELGRKSLELRRYLLRRLACMRDTDLEPVLKSAARDKDPEAAFFAALGLLALGSDAGLDAVLVAAREQWSERREVIAAALTPARDARKGMLVWRRIGQARPTDQMAGLRVLRYLGAKEQKVMLRSYLESSDFAVKREAINLARVLHGEPPIEKLSSFQAINLAKQWLQKL